MFSQTFASAFLSSPQSHHMEDHHSVSTDTPQFSMECESNPELNYTKFINLDESDEDKAPQASTSPKLKPSSVNNGFFKPIFSNLQQFVSSQLNQSDYIKLIEKSKRIIKRENAKKRVKMNKIKVKEEEDIVKNQSIKCEDDRKDDSCKKEVDCSWNKNEEEDKKIMPIEKSICKKTMESSETGPADKDMKKVIQKLRNRISAQQSRDRKKQYLENLERENQLLQEEIKALKEKKQSESQNQEKKMNPLGILKLGMAFLSLFMIIVGSKNHESSGNLKEIKGCPENKEDSLKVLEKMNFWKKMEFEETNEVKIDRQVVLEIMENLKRYFFILKKQF